MAYIKAFFLFSLLVASAMAAPAEEKPEAPAAEEAKVEEAPAAKSAPAEPEKSEDDGSWFAGKYDPIFTPVPVFHAAYPAFHHAVPVPAVHAYSAVHPAVHPAIYPYSALPAVRVL